MRKIKSSSTKTRRFLFPTLLAVGKRAHVPSALLLHPVGIPVAKDERQHADGFRQILDVACSGATKIDQLVMSSKFFISLVDALEALHKYDILHRDIKLENILAVPVPGATGAVIIVVFVRVRVRVRLRFLRPLYKLSICVHPDIQTAIK